MVDIIAQETDGYDKIADFIASKIDQAFSDLLQDLAQGNFKSFAEEEVSITSDELKNFLTVLGGADLAIQFTPKLLKGTKVKFSATNVSAPAQLLGGEVTISIGGRWSF